MLVALVVLPLEKSGAMTGTRPADRIPGPSADRVDELEAQFAAVDTGSVPAAARATRVVLPAPAASPDIRS
jgi:hypothetical protein